MNSPSPALAFVRRRLPIYVLLVMALASLIYAVVTAPKVGIDLRFFQTGAREWADGVFEIGAGVVGVYTPFLLPMLYPIAYLSYDTLAIAWLVLNIVSAAFVLDRKSVV